MFLGQAAMVKLDPAAAIFFYATKLHHRVAFSKNVLVRSPACEVFCSRRRRPILSSRF